MTEMPITRKLPVTLTRSEVLAHGETLARLEHTYEDQAQEAKDAAKAAKDALATLREKILDLVDRIERKQELRDVPCIEEPDVERQRVALVRTDTGEIVEIREMTISDRQLAMWESGAEVAPREEA